MDLQTASKIASEMDAYMPKIKNVRVQRVNEYVVACDYLGPTELEAVAVTSEEQWEEYKSTHPRPERSSLSPQKPHPISAQEADKIFNNGEHLKSILITQSSRIGTNDP